jgi:hypothetical protein
MNKQKKFMLVTDDLLPAIKESETHTTPWGRVWVHGSDVMATFKRHGFVPPSEVRNDYFFKLNREGQA